MQPGTVYILIVFIVMLFLDRSFIFQSRLLTNYKFYPAKYVIVMRYLCIIMRGLSNEVQIVE